MLQVNNLDKSYGAQAIFESASFNLNPNERVGLVGRNGHGKSTLFKLILGHEQPDNGTISLPKGYTIGHLNQQLKQDSKTALEEASKALSSIERLTPYRAERILGGLGFSTEMMNLPPARLSGGYQIRVELTKLLLTEPDLLLLDEPTNYLDLPSVKWLESELVNWRGEIILITHDRIFMDTVCTHTMAISRRKIRKFEGGTSKLFEMLAIEDEVQQKTRQNLLKRKEEIESFAAKNRAKASKAKLVQSRLKELSRMEISDEIQEDPNLSFKFSYAEFFAKRIAEIKNLTFNYPDNPTLIDQLSFVIEPNDRIGIMGKNGKGKSTLLRLLTNELNPSAGDINYHDKTSVGYLGQSNVERLNERLTVEEEINSSNPQLSRTAVRAICGAMMFSSDLAEKQISVLSGGERNRVMLGKILATPTNLIFLDEPTNHLDMESIDSLISAIQDFKGAVVFVTHSELMLKKLAKKLIVFSDKGPELYLGNYDDYCESIDETVAVKTKSKSDGSSNDKKNKPKKIVNNKKFEERFNQLSKELENLETEIQLAASSKEYHKLDDLNQKRVRLEEEQLELLITIEG